MKKNSYFCKFHSWGHSNSVFNFLIFFVLLCVVHLKENDFWELKKNNIYTHDTTIKNGQVHHCSLKIKIYLIYF